MPTSSADVPPPPATGLEVRPFRALTYQERDPDHLARVSSPAYDLVTPAGRDHLAAIDPHNIVRLILPRVERPAAGHESDDGPGSAEEAGALLRRWEHERVLVREAEPALWLYELQPRQGPATRGWLGAVALPTPGSPAVLPHEDTYPRAVEGRRALLAATRTDLEPIVLAHDPQPTVTHLADHAQGGEPTLQLQDADGVRHRLWRVTDGELLGDLGDAFRLTGAVIADGHHRFAAARAHHGQRPADRGSDAVLALLTPMGVGGLRVEAIHRVVPDLNLATAAAAAAHGFRVTELPLGGDTEPVAPGRAAEAVVDAAHRWLRRTGETGFLLTDGHRLLHLTEPSAEMVHTIPPEAPEAWRGLDVVLAHHALMGWLWQRADDPTSVLVAHDVDEALRVATARSGVAVLLRPPSPGDVAAVARAGARMPRKSTLFVPKPRTGLVLRPHDS